MRNVWTIVAAMSAWAAAGAVAGASAAVLVDVGERADVGEVPGVVAEVNPLRFHSLPGRAGAAPVPPVAHIEKTPYLSEPPASGLRLMGQEPTEWRSSLPVSGTLEREFSVELWLLDHVNQPVGTLVRLVGTVMTDDGDFPIDCAVSYWNRRLRVEGTQKAAEGIVFDFSPRAFIERWRHVVVSYNGSAIEVFVNGAFAGEQFVGEAQLAWDRVEFGSYLQNEPYMQTHDLVRLARVYNRALTRTEAAARFTHLSGMVERGVIIDTFHFNAGPYLQNVTADGATVLWETDRASEVEVYVATSAGGLTTPVATILTPRDPDNGAFIGEHRVTGLVPGTAYFYKLVAKPVGEGADREAMLDTGVLTFKTAVRTSDAQGTNPIRFALIGDTEARPHINRRLAELVWGERPDFIVNVGDLTDGGMKGNKFEWNHEYFAGMSAIIARVPLFPVPGNGEGDLYWYNRFHSLPTNVNSSGNPESYYTFTWGDAQFFMLDSNRSEAEFAPGGAQHEWLSQQLAASTATWKIVCHHHAPYSSDEDDYGDSWQGPTSLGDLNVRQIVPLYEKHGVDLVFFGHLHTHERTFPVREGRARGDGDGVVYLQAGGAGGNLEDFAPTRSFFSGKTYRGHHYTLITINAGQLELKTYDLDGDLRDVTTMRK